MHIKIIIGIILTEESGKILMLDRFCLNHPKPLFSHEMFISL